jgi:hypothetical protein
MGTCNDCSKEDETRPYGPNGEAICFDCAMATPEKKQQTINMMHKLMEAAGPVVMIGTEDGPIPLTKSSIH